MAHQLYRSASALGMTLALSACGGGGGPSFTYVPPPPAPAPDPNPVPPPMPAGPIGLTGGPFVAYSTNGSADGNLVVSDTAVQISYSADGDVYTITAPGLQQGHLVDTTIDSGSWNQDGSDWDKIYSTGSSVTLGDSETRQSGYVTLGWAQAPYSASSLTYTSFGSWSGDGTGGVFAYGIPTVAGDVPTTGSADYSGQIQGYTSGDGSIFGTVGLQFDFAAATLSGSIEPSIYTDDGWSSASLGTYTFQDTVYSRNSTTFSGAFAIPGADSSIENTSSFHGNFNGPGGVEVMGNFTTPYHSPVTGQWGTMTGVFGAGKAP